jgi:hypothetical protein
VSSPIGAVSLLYLTRNSRYIRSDIVYTAGVVTPLWETIDELLADTTEAVCILAHYEWVAAHTEDLLQQVLVLLVLVVLVLLPYTTSQQLISARCHSPAHARLASYPHTHTAVF